MLSEEQRRKITEFAARRCQANDPMHRMDHLRRTALIALELAAKEHGSADVCWVAAMLHDICKNDDGDHGTRGAGDAGRFLLSIGVDGEIVSKVRDAIHFHNKEFEGGPVERQIVWDADKLQTANLEEFKSRMLPYWCGKLGERKGIDKSIDEYYFFKQRFHTRTAKTQVENESGRMEEYFRELMGDG